MRNPPASGEADERKASGRPPSAGRPELQEKPQNASRNVREKTKKSQPPRMTTDGIFSTACKITRCHY
jgi:hypothetical protein